MNQYQKHLRSNRLRRLAKKIVLLKDRVSALYQQAQAQGVEVNQNNLDVYQAQIVRLEAPQTELQT